MCAFTGIVAGRDVVEGRGGIWPRQFYCKSEKRLPFILSSAFLVFKSYGNSSFDAPVSCLWASTVDWHLQPLDAGLRCGDMNAAASVIQQLAM